MMWSFQSHVPSLELKSTHIHVSTNETARGTLCIDGLPHSETCGRTRILFFGSWGMDIPDFHCIGRFFKIPRAVLDGCAVQNRKSKRCQFSGVTSSKVSVLQARDGTVQDGEERCVMEDSIRVESQRVVPAVVLARCVEEEIVA